MTDVSPRRVVRDDRDERGSATPLIVGFAVVLLLMVAVVVDASAAFLHRQGLDTLADGAALFGADAGAEGGEVYGGLDDQSLELTTARARAGVRSYLADIGAHGTYPGLQYVVTVRGDQVVVTISAPLDLPLTVPGAPQSARVSATSSAEVHLEWGPDNAQQASHPRG